VLLETEGPHKDTAELRLGAYRWMNRWLKGDKGDVSEKEHARFTPQQLKVFDNCRPDAINATIQETFVKPARPDLPSSPEVAREWWKGTANGVAGGLARESVSRLAGAGAGPGCQARGRCESRRFAPASVRFRQRRECLSRLWLLTAEKVEKATLVVLTAVDERAGRIGPVN